MNDNDRQTWIDNDEGLYDLYRRWRRRNKGGKRGFVRAHRDLIDRVADNVASGARRQHYLKYG